MIGVFLFVFVILLVSFVSAGVFSDAWNKITGKATGGVCEETDDGIDYYTYGTAKGIYSSLVLKDTCWGDKLGEQYCLENEGVGTLQYDCPNGCSDGACISDTEETCSPESSSTTCGSSVCGTKTNNCGQSVSCGSCSSGEICSGGQCITSESSTSISSGDGSLWSTSGSNIFYNNGNIGIGTTTPQYPLSLGKTAGKKLALVDNGNDFYGFGISSGTLEIYSGMTTGDEPPEIVVKHNGKVGIGTIDPQAELEISGNVKISSLAGNGIKFVCADVNGMLVPSLTPCN